MKALFGTLLAMALGVAVSGCLPSANPPVAKNEVEPKGLEGVWVSGDDVEYKIELDGDCYAVSRTGESAKTGPDAKSGPFKLYISRTGDTLFATTCIDMDGLKKEYKRDEGAMKFMGALAMNVSPVFWTFKMELSGDSLKLLAYEMDKDELPPRWLAEKAKMSFAFPEELRAWLAKSGAKQFTKEDSSFTYARKDAGK